MQSLKVAIFLALEMDVNLEEPERYYHNRAINYEIMKRLSISDLIRFAYDPNAPPLRQEIYNSSSFWYDKTVEEYQVISPQLNYDWRQIYHFISRLEFFDPKNLRLADLGLDQLAFISPHDDVVRYYLAGPHDDSLPPIINIERFSALKIIVESHQFDDELDADLLSVAIMNDHEALVEILITMSSLSFDPNDLIIHAIDYNAKKTIDVLLRLLQFDSDIVMTFILKVGTSGSFIGTLVKILKDPRLNVMYQDYPFTIRHGDFEATLAIFQNPNFQYPPDEFEKYLDGLIASQGNEMVALLKDSRIFPLVLSGQFLQYVEDASVEPDQIKKLEIAIIRMEIQHEKCNQLTMEVAFRRVLPEFAILLRMGCGQDSALIDLDKVLTKLPEIDGVKDQDLYLSNLDLLLSVGAQPTLVWGPEGPNTYHIIADRRIVEIFFSHLSLDSPFAFELIETIFNHGSNDVIKMILEDRRFDPFLESGELFQKAIIENYNPGLVKLLLEDGRFDPLQCHGAGIFNITLRKLEYESVDPIFDSFLASRQYDPFLVDVITDDNISATEFNNLIRPWLNCGGLQNVGKFYEPSNTPPRSRSPSPTRPLPGRSPSPIREPSRRKGVPSRSRSPSSTSIRSSSFIWSPSPIRSLSPIQSPTRRSLSPSRRLPSRRSLSPSPTRRSLSPHESDDE
ncbi:Hypothetical protein POVR1_LOCUS126 [uncultured virus]|nr:Hypothetical protein POVR1_LOCUS126 [uncultured virus]